MLNYEHRKLRETIKSLDEVPEDPAAFSRWIEATAHLEFLRQNALADELVVHASGDYTFVISLSVPNDRLATVDKGDLRN